MNIPHLKTLRTLRGRSALQMSFYAAFGLLAIGANSTRAELADGLVGYWSFDGNLEDSSESDPPAHGVGKIWEGNHQDSPENLADLELADANYVTGKFGDCVKFADSFYVETPLELEDRFDFGAIDDLDEDDPEEEDPDLKGFTVSAWVTVDQFTKSWQCLAGKGEQNQWRMHRRGEGRTFTGNGGNGDTPDGVIEAPEDEDGNDTWYHVLLRSDRENDRHDFWVNGTMDAEEDAIAPTGNVMPMMIGQNPDTGDRTWEGNIDDVAMWNRPLTDEEIAEIWSGGEGTSVESALDPSDPNIAGSKSAKIGPVPIIDTDTEFELSVRNTGDTKALEVSDVVLSGPDADHFAIVESPTSIDAEGRAAIKMTFNGKQQLGEFKAQVDYKTNDPDADDQAITVAITAFVPNPDGPLAHYRLDETDTAGEAADSTGNGYVAGYDANGGSATLGGTPLAEGLGTSLAVNGGGLFEYGPGFPLNSDFTISLWMTPNALGNVATADLLTIVGQGSNSPEVALLLASGELHWFGDPDAPDVLFSTDGANIEVGTTYHTALVYDSATNTGKIVLDGKEVASGDVPQPQTDGTFYAGAFGPGALPFNGGIDDIQFYDRALSIDDDIAFLIANPGEVLNPFIDPNVIIDSDQDGLSDSDEVTIHGTDPLKADTDGDGLDDGDEIARMINPLSNDSDEDGFKDGFEVANGSDPGDANSPAAAVTLDDTGLIAYYPFDGDLEDKSGDSHGEGVGAEPIAFADGKFGQGIDLNGVDQYVVTPEANEDLFDFGAPDSPTGFTVSAWFRVDAFDKNWQALIAKGEGNRWRIHRQGGENSLAPVGGNGDIGQGSTSVNDGEIHHMALVSEPDVGVSYYLDGVLIETGAPPTLENNDQPMMIGENPDGLGRTWNGLIDDVSLWSRPLSTSEVLAVANSSGSLSELISGADTIAILGTGADSLLGGDLTDPENDGLDALGGGTDPSWNWVAITSNVESDFEGGENSFNIFDNKVGGGNDKWCCDDPTPDNPYWVSVEFAAPVSLTHFTITNGNDTPDRDPTNWQIQGSNDGVNFETIFSETEVSIWSETRNEVALVTLGAPSPAYSHLRYIVFDTPGSLHQLNEIEYFGNVVGVNVLTNGSFEEPVLDNINTNNLGTAPTGWSQTGDNATWNLIRNDGTAYGSGVDNAADGSQIIDLNGIFEIFQNFTLDADSAVTFGASFANREGHDGSDPSTVGIYDASGNNLLSPEVSVDTSADPTPSEVWSSGEASANLVAGEYQIRIALNNFNNVDNVFVNASSVGDDTPDRDVVGFIGTVVKASAADGGAVSLGFPDGKAFDVEFSEDLVNWTVIANGVTGTFEDPNPARTGSTSGYYRGIAP